MRIGVNTLPLFPGQIGGMETYTVNLLTHLAAIDRQHSYYLFVARIGAGRAGALPPVFLGADRPRDPEGPGRGSPQQVAMSRARLMKKCEGRLRWFSEPDEGSRMPYEPAASADYRDHRTRRLVFGRIAKNSPPFLEEFSRRQSKWAPLNLSQM